MASFVILFCMAIGFAVSGAVSSLYQLVSAERADFLVDRETVAGNVVAVLLSLFAGPYILLRNAVCGARARSIPLLAALLMGAVAVFWSVCAGIVYLHLAVST